jgi:hypothetical protein
MAFDWIQLSPNHYPPARFSHAMGFNPTTFHPIVFGGQSAVGAHSLNDTWEWDGADWNQLNTANSPGARTAMGYSIDIARQQTVIFGGFDGSNTLSANNETWVFDGTDWTQKFPAHSPSARWFSSMGYDFGNSTVVLWSGRNNASLDLHDTWKWNGTDWTQVFPASSPTVGEYWPRNMVFDNIQNSVLFFGGAQPSSVLLPGKTWKWSGSGNTWTQLSPSHPSTSRQLASLAHLPLSINSGTLMFGGANTFQLLDETWLFSSIAPFSATMDWTQQSPAHHPSARENTVMMYSSLFDYVLLFGGETTGTIANSETWIYVDVEPHSLHLETSSR